ncbi:MAG: tetratricopeptide (TPR) repeat protein [Planctomycetota bacterium]|jgi:tetratricopeptide (TPR) repeat protein
MTLRTLALLAFALPLQAAPQQESGTAPTVVRTQDPAPAPVPVPTRAEARALINAGDFAGATTAYSLRRAADNNDGEAAFMLGYCLHASGKLQEAHDMHLEATAFANFSALANYNHACIHSMWGQADAAFKALDEAHAAGFNNANQLRTDTDMDGIRADPRFAAFIAKVEGRPAPAVEVAPEEPAEPQPAPLASLANAQRFDFLKGHWNVNPVGDEERVSVANVESIFDGGALRVTLTNTADGKVRTESTYYPIDGGWRMVWMNPSGNSAVLEGGLVNGQMVMTMVSADGASYTTGRAVFSNISADGFDYHWWSQDEEGNWANTNQWRYASAN